ncbi:MAG: GumC family protein [Armatimonadota bacterium]
MRSYWLMFVRQRRMMLGIFSAIFLLGMAWTLTRPALYRAEAEVLVTPVEQASNPGTDIAGDIGLLTRVRSVANEIKMMQSPDMLDEAFAALAPEIRRQGYRTSMTRMNQYPVHIVNPKDTDIIAVTVTARDPDAAAAFANQILQSHHEHRQESTSNLAKKATEHIDVELQACEKDLQQATAELARYQEAQGVVDPNVQLSADASSLANLEAAATAAQAEMARANAAKQMYLSELKKVEPNYTDSVVTADNPLVHTINAEIERLNQERAALLQEYKPDAPEVRAKDDQIVQARRRLTEAKTTTSNTTTVRRNPALDTLRQNYIGAIVAEREAASRAAISQGKAGAVRSRINRLPASQARMTLMNSKIAELANTHAYLQSQKQTLTMSLSGGLSNVMPFSEARANPKPVSPNIPLSAILLVLFGAIAAVGMAVLCEQFDDRVHTSENLENLTGHRVLASLPRVEHGFNGLVTSKGCPPGLLESFRILRGNLLLALDPLPQVIMITSSQPGEGKTTTVANLAAAIALGGKRVLVVDADMRHPSLHLAYGLLNDIGLSQVLQAEMSVEEVIRQTSIRNLYVLSAGPVPNYPPELLASPEMGLLLERQRGEYDHILVDSTPIHNLSDGIALAPQMDGVVVVVSSAHARHPELQGALRNLEQVGATILGLVYNRSADTPALTWKGR